MKSLSRFFCVAICISSGHVMAKASQSSVKRQLTSMTTKDWSVETVTKGLNYPWDIEHSAGRLILTEAAGNIVMIENGNLKRFSLKTSDKIVNEGGGGLLGIALSNNFAKDGVAYFYHSFRSSSGLLNKVIQAKFDGKSWVETKTLLTDIPGHKLYNGGRIAIGPDQHLYVTTGWTENRERPQDLKSLAGKVLRLNLDGKVPSDNPFKDSYVYSLGHRNPQGLSWNNAGDLFVVEHGQFAHDEINQIKAGKNYGWPLVSGSESRKGMENPWLDSGDETWAPSGATIVGNELLFVALAARALYAVDMKTKSIKAIFSSGDRLRDVLSVGDDIYLITTNRSPKSSGPSEDSLLKISRKN